MKIHECIRARGSAQLGQTRLPITVFIRASVTGGGGRARDILLSDAGFRATASLFRARDYYELEKGRA